jgi:hypothetical protein
VWVILCRHMGWVELDEINHVVMQSRWIYRCLVWRYSCMIVIAPLLWLMHVTRSRVTWYFVLGLYCLIIYIGCVLICEVFYLPWHGFYEP